jgi:hypothetical protein
MCVRVVIVAIALGSLLLGSHLGYGMIALLWVVLGIGVLVTIGISEIDDESYRQR